MAVGNVDAAEPIRWQLTRSEHDNFEVPVRCSERAVNVTSLDAPAVENLTGTVACAKEKLCHVIQNADLCTRFMALTYITTIGTGLATAAWILLSQVNDRHAGARQR